MAERYRYWAFISYSHGDAGVAHWLHRALENFRTPRDLPGIGVPKRLFPVFLDREELPSSDHLSTAVVESLACSRHLIVVCSPRAAASHWVNQEIRQFRALGHGRILCLIASGDPQAAPESGDACFPPALFEGGDDEPVAADLRPGGDGRAGALRKLVAGILAIPLAELTQREFRRQRRNAIVAVTASLAVAAVTSTLAVIALAARDAAREQALRAETVRGFLIGMFREQDPLARTRPEARTPGEIIDVAVRQLDADPDSALARTPQIRDELLHELGTIQLSLGNTDSALTLLERAVSGRGARTDTDDAQLAASQTALATALLRVGRNDEAEVLASTAVATLAGVPDADPVLRARAELVLGNTLSFGRGAPEQAGSHYRQALAQLEAARGPDDPETLLALYSLAQMHSQARNDPVAESLLQRIIARDDRQGSAAVIAAYAHAERGRVQLRRGDFGTAIESFESAIAAMRAGGIERGPFLVGTYTSMALARRDSGALERALEDYQAAERLVSSEDLSKRQDILRGRGRVLLELGRAGEAETDLRHAYEMRRDTTGYADGMTWYLASEWGRALAAMGRYDEAEAIQRRAVDKIREIMGAQAHQNALVLDVLAGTLEARGNAAALREAEVLRRQALAITAARYPEGSPLWGQYALMLADNLIRSDDVARHQEAGSLLSTALTELRSRAAGAAQLARALELQARLLKLEGRAELALAARHEAQQLRLNGESK